MRISAIDSVLRGKKVFYTNVGSNQYVCGIFYRDIKLVFTVEYKTFKNGKYDVIRYMLEIMDLYSNDRNNTYINTYKAKLNEINYVCNQARLIFSSDEIKSLKYVVEKGI